MREMEHLSRAANLVLALRKTREKSGKVMWAWLQKKLVEHFTRVRNEALHEAASHICTDCAQHIQIANLGGTFWHRHRATNAYCRAADLRKTTGLGSWLP